MKIKDCPDCGHRNTALHGTCEQCGRDLGGVQILNDTSHEKKELTWDEGRALWAVFGAGVCLVTIIIAGVLKIFGII